MRPEARVQTAIEILDRVIAGDAAERALTTWARTSRYAGSKDRAAVRDHVFDVLRSWRSCAALGGAEAGGETGRALMLGHLRASGQDVDGLFSGGGYGPAALGDADSAGRAPEGYEAWDLPDWLGEAFEASLGDQAEAVAKTLRSRADVFLRVNTLKTDLPGAIAALAENTIEAEPHALSPSALRVTKGGRAVARSRAYLEGLVELQDAASQAVADALPLLPGARVLDYCAGGGGKTLAMAAKLPGTVIEAHDANPDRMSDLPARAERAGVEVKEVTAPQGLYDLVLADAPCSGSGAWRRSPEGKWRLSAETLEELCATQTEILCNCRQLVAPGGILAYATCSVLMQENSAQIDRFLEENQEFTLVSSRQFLPAEGGDGFFIACLSLAK